MRAVVCRAHGPIESLTVEDIEPPPLRAGCVRIRVHATGVAFANILSVEGKHQNRPPLPYSPGNEVAGEVVEVGPGVSRLAPGDRVCAGCEWGGYAEEVVVPEGTVYRIPPGLPFERATHFPILYGTAWGALSLIAKLRPGQTLLVHGAAGGTGSAAVEVGRALGAEVIATAGGADKCAVAREHGAAHVVDYRATPIREAVLDLTNGRGVDLVYDPVGGDAFDQSLRCTAPEGMLLAIGFAAGRIPQIPANILLVKNLRVAGFYWGYWLGWGRSRAPEAERARVRDAMETLIGRFDEGIFAPRVHAVLPLEQAVAALDIVRSRAVIGKVVLTPGQAG